MALNMTMIPTLEANYTHNDEKTVGDFKFTIAHLGPGYHYVTVPVTVTVQNLKNPATKFEFRVIHGTSSNSYRLDQISPTAQAGTVKNWGLTGFSSNDEVVAAIQTHLNIQ